MLFCTDGNGDTICYFALMDTIYGICNITVCLSEHCLWINLEHSMNITDFTTNPTTTDCTRVFPKVTTKSHSLRRGSSSFHCLPSGLFSPLHLYTC